MTSRQFNFGVEIRKSVKISCSLIGDHLRAYVKDGIAFNECSCGWIMVAWQQVKELMKRFQSSAVGCITPGTLKSFQ